MPDELTDCVFYQGQTLEIRGKEYKVVGIDPLADPEVERDVRSYSLKCQDGASGKLIPRPEDECYVFVRTVSIEPEQVKETAKNE